MLNNRLEQIGIDAIIHDADKYESLLPVNPPTASAVHVKQQEARDQ